MRKCKAKYMTDYLRITNLNIKNMKHIYFTHYRFYITQKLYICTMKLRKECNLLEMSVG